MVLAAVNPDNTACRTHSYLHPYLLWIPLFLQDTWFELKFQLKNIFVFLRLGMRRWWSRVADYTSDGKSPSVSLSKQGVDTSAERIFEGRQAFASRENVILKAGQSGSVRASSFLPFLKLFNIADLFAQVTLNQRHSSSKISKKDEIHEGYLSCSDSERNCRSPWRC